MLFTLPNILTISRIFAIPALIATFYFKGNTAHWAALAIFIAAGITDFLDGYFARKRGQFSKLGQFLDPVADKLLIASAILMLVAFKAISGLSVLAAVVILCREILVSGLREFLAEIKVGVPVTRLAKWKTAVQIVAIAFLLVGDSPPLHMPLREIGLICLWAAAVLTLYTGYDYLRAGLKHMAGDAV
jgi:cardiolipin synthase